MTTMTAVDLEVSSALTTDLGDVGNDSSEITHEREAIGADVLKFLFDAAVERGRPLDETASSVEARVDRVTSYQRDAASVIAKDPKLVLGILSFIHAQGSIEADQLMSYGPSRLLFGIVFDLYDAGMLLRSEGVVSVSPFGLKVLSRAGIA